MKVRRRAWVSTAVLAALLNSTAITAMAEETGLPPLGDQSQAGDAVAEPKETAPLAYYEERGNLAYFKELREIIGYLHRLDLLSQNLYVKAEELDSDAIKVKKSELLASIENVKKKIKTKTAELKSYMKDHPEAQKAISLDLNNLNRIQKSIEKLMQSSNALFESAASESGDFSDRLGSNVIQRAALFLDINTSELEGAIDLDKTPKGPLQRFRIMSVILNNKFISRNFEIAYFNLSQYLGDAPSSENMPKMEEIGKLSDVSMALLNDQKSFLAKEADSEKTALYANIHENEVKIYKLNQDFYNRLKNVGGKSDIKEWFETYSILLKDMIEKRQELDQAIALEEGGTGAIINPNAEKDVRGIDSKGESQEDSGAVNFDELFKR